MSTDARCRATVRKKSQLTLPPEIREALHVAEGDEVEFIVTKTGEVWLRGLAVIPADQRWFWTEPGRSASGRRASRSPPATSPPTSTWGRSAQDSASSGSKAPQGSSR